MAVNYYQDSIYYPETQLAITDRILAYYAQLLYPNEEYTGPNKTGSKYRFFQTTFGNDDAAIKKTIDRFKTSQGRFPFTAYSIGEDERQEYFSHYQKNGNYYSEELESYITFLPINMTFEMVTFYTSAFDFDRAIAILTLDAFSLSRIDVPIMINDKLCSFPIDLDFEITKGDLSFDIEQQFATGKLYPLVHTTTVKGVYFVLVDSSIKSGAGVADPTVRGQQAQRIYPVDDIILSLKELESRRNIETKHSPDTPIVTSSDPINNETGFDKTSSIIINFNVSMDESSVLGAIDIIPFTRYNAYFDSDSKILAIDPSEDLQALTTYEITINKNARSMYTVPMESDYILTFTTEA